MYRAEGFIEKNRETLGTNFQSLMENSQNRLITDLFTTQLSEAGTLKKGWVDYLVLWDYTIKLRYNTCLNVQLFCSILKKSFVFDIWIFCIFFQRYFTQKPVVCPRMADAKQTCFGWRRNFVQASRQRFTEKVKYGF